MNDCPNCEYHRKRAQLWREEAYKQAGHPLPEREWVGLTDEEIWSTVSRIGTSNADVNPYQILNDARAIEQRLKEKNT